MLEKLKNIDWTRAMFLVPILLVAGISISHVVSWYDMANPYNWAIYLSVAIEVGAMTSLIAATKKIKGGVWFMFGIVTFIQVLGNIFYSYANIEETDILFQKWIELTSPVFEAMGTDPGDIIPHKRWLALLEGGLLPLISLTSLHFYTKYEKTDQDNDETNDLVEKGPSGPSQGPTEGPSDEPNNGLDLDNLPAGTYTVTVEDKKEDEVNDEGGLLEEAIEDLPKNVYNNVMDVDSKEEPDQEDEEDEKPVPEEERQKHLKFRKRLIKKEEEKKEVQEKDHGRKVEIVDDGKKMLIYPKTIKRDKISQKRIN